MIAQLVRLAGVLLWLVSSVFLATSTAADKPTLRVAAAVIVGLPGVAALWQRAGEYLGRPSHSVRTRAKLALQSAVVSIIREKMFDGDVTRVSLHVWLVPTWYRRLVPLRIRRRRKPDGRRLPAPLRPKLQRAAIYRIAHHQESGIPFRKGIGIVGRCIDLNEPEKVHRVRLDSPEYRHALAEGRENWARQPLDITQNLKFQHAEQLSETYGQVVAIVLRTRKGDAFGCVTLDLPLGARRIRMPTKTNPTGDALLQLLVGTASNLNYSLTT